MYFGLFDHSNPMDYDLATIFLKNILIEENNQKKYFWPFNTFDKDFLYDKINNMKITLLNTDWVIADHYYWNKKYEIEVSNYPLFAHDSVNSRVFIDDKTKLIIFNLFDFRDSVIHYKNKRPGKWHDLMYDNFRNKLYSTFYGRGLISVYDFKSNEWTEIDTTGEVDGHYYGNVKFINPSDSLVYLFGGYGWYTAKDKLFQYDFRTDLWKEVKLKNNIGYRFNMSVSPGFDSKHYLFWGGLGNYSNKQEEGFRHFFELYSFDLLNKGFTKIWDYKNANELNKYTHLFSNFFFSKEDSSFYFMMVYEVNNKNSYRLFRVDLKNSSISRVGDELSFDLTETRRNIFFCYDSRIKEFIFIRQATDSSKVLVYGLKYPAVQQQEIAAIVQTPKSEEQLPVILIIISSFLLLSLGYLIVKKRKQMSQRKSGITAPITGEQMGKNFIKTFGGFFIYDRNGNEISKNLSPKLKEIFLLILIKCLTNHRNGITSEELSSIIWPDSSPESVNSNRGVAINKIRKFLLNIDGITLEFSDKLWSIKINNGAVFDF